MIKALLSLLLIGTLLLSIMGLTLTYSLQGQRIAEKAQEQNLYGRLSDNLPNLIGDNIASESGFQKDELASIITSSIDASRFYDFLSQSATSYLDYLMGRTAELAFEYDLKPVKEKIIENATSKMMARYDNLAICTNTQIKGWTANGGFPSCKIDETITEDVQRTLIADFQRGNFFNTLPDKITFNSDSQTIRNNRQAITTVMRALNYNYLLTLFLIFLFLIIYRRKAFFSLSIVFILVGLVFVAGSFVMWDLVNNLINQLTTSSDLDKTILPIALDLADSLAQSIKTNLGNISILTVVLGILLLVIALATKERKRLTIGPVTTTQPPHQ